MKLSDLYSQWDGTYQGNTNVIETDTEFLVTYYSECGTKTTKLIFRKKPNPIGFIWRDRNEH